VTGGPEDVRPAFHRAGRTDGDVDAEFAFHIEQRTRALVDAGWEPAAAKAEALRRFGNVEDARRYCEATDKRRNTRMLRTEYVREFTQDLGYAVRSLRKAPGFAFFAILTLALGIGANTSIFSVVRGILLRPMPFAAPEQLVTIQAIVEGRTFSYFSPANLLDIQAQTRTLAGLALYTADGLVLTGAGDPERLRGADVSASFFDVLGVRPVRGRLSFTADEDAPNGAPVVVISDALWRSRFSADTGIVGRTITLDNSPYQVVGIAPSASAWPANATFWIPLKLDVSKTSRGAVYLLAVGRTKPGVTVEQAGADIRDIMARLAADYPDYNKGLDGTAADLRDALTGSVAQPLIVLLAAVTLVLLIACVNVANLILVRGVARQSEMAVRSALGAGRGRLSRQLVTESLVLATLGGVLGTALAYAATRGLVSIAPANIPRLDAVHLDGTVLAVALGVTFVTGLVFGIVPARQLARTDVSTTLREGGRGAHGGRASSRTRTTLVVAEVALAVMLVVGAGLLVQSFRRLMDVDPGFRNDHAVTFGLSLPNASYPDASRRATFADELTARLRANPGVRDVGISSALPLTPFSFGFSFEVTEHPPVPTGDQPSAQVRVANPGFFSTLGIPVMRGRAFTDADRAGAPAVMLITEEAARQFFPNEDPLGKHVKISWTGATPAAGAEVVGVVRDVKQSSLAAAPRPQFYLPFSQRPVSNFNIIIRPVGDGAAALRDSRAIVAGMDGTLAMSGVRTIEAVVAESVSQPRFYMTLLGGFAALALVLSAIGIYGVIAYVVGQRSREIGVRIALGASSGDVLRMVMRQGVGMTVIGVAIGIAGALALTKFMARLLYGVAPTDATTYGTTVVVLVGVAALASLVPALRASRADPTVAMRAE
jgi:predicted permease